MFYTSFYGKQGLKGRRSTALVQISRHSPYKTDYTIEEAFPSAELFDEMKWKKSGGEVEEEFRKIYLEEVSGKLESVKNKLMLLKHTMGVEDIVLV